MSNLKMWLVTFVSLVVVLGTYFLLNVSYNNTDKRLRNTLTAKEGARQAVYDETWKSIKQIAQVSEKYSADFKEIYPKLMEGRYGNARGGALLSFVTESNPDLSTDLYKKLANTIEIKRAEFTNIQKQLLDIKREHDNLLDTFPGSHFLSGLEKTVVVVITSSKTKAVIESGEENDISVF